LLDLDRNTPPSVLEAGRGIWVVRHHVKRTRFAVLVLVPVLAAVFPLTPPSSGAQRGEPTPRVGRCWHGENGPAHCKAFLCCVIPLWSLICMECVSVVWACNSGFVDFTSNTTSSYIRMRLYTRLVIMDKVTARVGSVSDEGAFVLCLG
jgi:hypothetical protein